ncbi:MAG: condensation domain-containing protein, partial [Bacteroidota bacterium]
VRPTNGQKRLYLLQQLHPGNPFYQYAHRYELRGPLNVDELRESFRWVTERQKVLRTNFIAEENGVINVVTQPPDEFPLEVTDLRTATPAARRQAEKNFVAAPFDLSRDALFRARLFLLEDDHYHLLVAMHHIIGDRGSLLVLEGELFGHYTRLVEGRTEHPAAPGLTFADYAHWEATREVPESHYAYWREQLTGEIPRAELPQDRQRPTVASHRGQLLEAELSPEVSARVNILARRHGTTANVVFLAVLNAFLYRYTGQEDLLVGAPVSTRDRTEIEALVGFLNETVVLRHQLNPEEGLEALVAGLKPTVETALTHKDVPFDWLVDNLQPARAGGANPFFQTMFVYNGQAPERVLPAGLTVTDQYVDLGTAKFDLTLFATDLGDTFRIGFEYAADLFDADTVQTMLNQFVVLLTDATDQPEAAIATRSEGAEGRARSYTEMTRPDTDGDGTVTFAEAVADADAQMQDRLQRGNLGFDLMLLDADGDGVLTVPEATETLAAIGAHVSANGLPPHLTGRSPARAG